MAVNCPLVLGLNAQITWIEVYELSLNADVRDLTLGCPGVVPVSRARVRGSVADGGAAYDRATVRTGLEHLDGTTPLDFELPLPPGQGQALLVVTGQGGLSPDQLVHLKVVRGLDVAVGDTLDLGTLHLVNPDRLGSGRVEDYRNQVPSGFTSRYRVALATAGGLFYDGLGGGDASGGSYRTLRTPPEEDRLVAITEAKDSATLLYDYQVHAAGTRAPMAFSFGDPNGFSPVFAATDPPAFERLSSDPPAQGLELVYMVSYAGTLRIVKVLVSATWLEGRDRYDPGDLGTLPGFQAAAIPSGSMGSWQAGALLADTDLQAILAEPRLPWVRSGGFPYPTAPLPLMPGTRVRLVVKGGVFSVP